MADIPRLIGSAETSLRSVESAADRQRAFAEVAQEFEAMLLLQVVKQMREPLLDAGDAQDSMFQGGALLETIDAELSRQLAKQPGLGIARALQPQAAAPPASAVGSGTRVAPAASPRASSSPPSPAPVAPALAPPQGANLSFAPLTRPDMRISSRYGWRRDPFSSEPRFHAGIDMAAKAGEVVPAAAPGRVVFAGRAGGYGLSVIVEHEPGVRTRYAHLSEISVEAEDVVGSGQVLGRVGSTGRSTGPHLHFEVLEDGRPIDPLVASRGARLSRTKGHLS